MPSYLDRSLQNLYLFVLDVFQEETADTSSFGFRKFRSPGWAAKAVTLRMWNRRNFGFPTIAVSLDIAKCFDNISHEFLLANVATFNYKGTIYELVSQSIMTQWLKCGFILAKDATNTLFPTTGIPQWGPISPCVANIVLNGLEPLIHSFTSPNIDKPSMDVGSRAP